MHTFLSECDQQRPVFSIVTISFNQRAYLATCIESVTQQLGLGDEYIVVDPGSTDGSLDLIREYASRTPSMRMIFEKDNGPADGLNCGFSNASGEIYAYINADDFLLPGALSFARSFFIENPKIDVLVSPIKRVDQTGRFFWRGAASQGLTVDDIARGRSYYVQQGTFIRAEAFHRAAGFHAANKTCWDFELVADLLLSGSCIRQVNRPLGAFRLHSESISGKGDHLALSEIDLQRIRLKATSRLGLSGGLTEWDSLLKMLARFSPVRRIREIITALY